MSTSPGPSASNLHALLIGVNCYMPNRLPDGTFYRSLVGCVPDVLSVERFLRERMGLADERLIRLTASDPADPSDPRPPEPPAQWPTYRNIVASFRKLRDAARPGDQVYVHYSGHGGRAATLPEHSRLIPGKLIDEALVPTDIGNSEAQYLRDIELAFLLREMVEKGLLVTLVLDSCHSGSATRESAEVRGSGVIDTTPRPARSLVADDAALAENWRRAADCATRDLEVGSGWLPDPRGYVLLAACRANEGAYEFPFDGGEKRGALTYWLLDSFEQLGPGITYRAVYRHVYARIHTQFAAQTPQLEGEGDRVAFGSESVPARDSFIVMAVAPDARQLTLNAGRVHGLGAGARLAVFSAADGARTAVVELVEPGLNSSTARVLGRGAAAQIRQGDGAVLLTPGAETPTRLVRLLATEARAPDAAPLEALEVLLRRDGGGYVRPARPDEAADFQVSVAERGEYVVLGDGRRPFANLGPALRVGERADAGRLVERLVHLSKYLNLLELANRDSRSALAHLFSVELIGPPPANGANGGAQASAGPLEPRALKAGDWVSLRARNNSAVPINVTVLDLRPDWSVVQIFPSRAGLFETLEAGRELYIPLRADLPPGYEEGTDVLKVFATTGGTDFKGFQLPVLDLSHAHAPHATRSASDACGGPDFCPEASTRDMGAPFVEGEDWAAFSLNVSVRRDGVEA